MNNHKSDVLLSGAKPFDCQHCEKKFRTSAHRKSHVMSHFRDPNHAHPRPRRVFRRSARNDMLQDIPMQEPILITDTGKCLSPIADTGKCLSPVTDSGKCLSFIADTGKCLPPIADIGKCLPRIAVTGKCLSPINNTGKCLFHIDDTGKCLSPIANSLL